VQITPWKRGARKLHAGKGLFCSFSEKRLDLRETQEQGLKSKGNGKDAKVRRINNAVHASHTTCT
jgi:hypothetical protein